MVELLSTNPAKLFGLYPRKGTIASGSDADIVIFDPEKRHLITAATQHSKTDYNLFEGTEVTGSPETVLLRGNVLVDGGELVAEPGVGEFVERAAFGQEALRRQPLARRQADGGAPDTFPPCPAPSVGQSACEKGGWAQVEDGRRWPRSTGSVPLPACGQFVDSRPAREL